ncbi:FtsX-like permease family protein [Candidatus Poribacteria bacterium]|nr:FtsX-like permease family protein [Candidatus Poribacteria bacterium]
MNITEGIVLGLSALRKNKLRSLLTMLGIIIGISGVVAVVSVGSGAKTLVLSELERIGQSNMIIVWRKHRERVDGRWQRVQSNEYLEYADGYAIQENCPSVVSLSPEIWGVNVHFKYRDKDRNIKSNATTPDYQENRNWYVEQGRFLSDEDIEIGAKVCVLGYKIWDELCDRNPTIVGDEVQINGIRFTAIGIMEEKGDSMASQGWDEMVIMPITAMQMRILNSGNRVGAFLIKSKSFETLEQTEQEVMRVLGWRHKDADRIFEIWSAKKEVKNVERVSNIIKGLLGGVASIALVVGGIGIMNIMLVSVTERTWEIGLRKAVGAKRRDVLFQFLIESVVISVAGGIIGILIGVVFGMGGAKLFSTFVAKGTNWPSVVSISSIIIATSVSFVIGVVFGLYPANRAAKLMPTEALRK